MDGWLEKQATLDTALANALIAATPESWPQAKVEVSQVEHEGTEEMLIDITSPDGRPEIISPTGEIFSVLYGLADFFRERGTVWTKVVYSVAEQNGSWSFKINYEY